MTHIFSEDGQGESGESLSAAIASAISSALSSFNGDHQLAVTVIINGYEFSDGKYHVKVSLQILDHNNAQDDLYHDHGGNKEKRDGLADDLAAGFVAATYNKDVFHHHDNKMDDVVHSLENQVEQQNNSFDTSTDHIILVAPDAIHQQIHNENLASNEGKPTLTNDAPTLDMGGVGSSHHKDAA